nr:hypothetical protein L203_02599 [Cryptococcus depauperatus CBS 7841]
MLTTLLTLSAMTLAVVAGPVHVESLASRSETHAVELINNCGSGEAVFLYAGDLHARGSGVIHGPLNGGVAWVDGWKGANCLASGKNCGIVEFSLLNAQTSGMSSADYSLLDGPDLGNHKFTYNMNFQYTGSCTNSPGPCTGNSAAQCPSSYRGADTNNGRPTQCTADNAGIRITFC